MFRLLSVQHLLPFRHDNSSSRVAHVKVVSFRAYARPLTHTHTSCLLIYGVELNLIKWLRYVVPRVRWNIRYVNAWPKLCSNHKCLTPNSFIFWNFNITLVTKSEIISTLLKGLHPLRWFQIFWQLITSGVYRQQHLTVFETEIIWIYFASVSYLWK